MTLFKIIKNMIALTIVHLLSACSGPSSLAPNLEITEQMKSKYVLTDNYANHRLQQKKLNTAGGQIAYIDVGQGPTIVLLHGVPSSSWLYRQMLPKLQDNFRVIALDLLGYGSSDKPKSNQQNYLPAAQAGYVEELLAELNISEYSLLFHDIGGLVAWELVTNDLATQEPAIQNLIVLNTIISEQGFKHPGAKKGVISRTMANAYSNKLSSSAVIELTFKNMGLTNNVDLSPGACDGYVVPMQEGASDALYDFLTGFDDAQFARLDSQIAGLTKFSGDTLVMWGDEDKVLTSGQIPQLQKVLDIREENLIIYDDNAHFLPEEVPADLVNNITAFLIK